MGHEGSHRPGAHLVAASGVAGGAGSTEWGCTWEYSRASTQGKRL